MNDNRIDDRFMELKIGDQLYAIPLLNVKEVIQKPDITVVPNSPTDFEGIMNLRGQILGVFSIRKKLVVKNKNDNVVGHPVVVVVEDQGVNVGMIVDEVTRVLYADSSKILPAPLKDDDPTRKFIASIIQTDEDLVLVLNLDQLLELQKYKASLQAA